MNPPETESKKSHSNQRKAAQEAEIQTLYRQLLESWNQQDASGFAGLFAENGYCIGFDGSQMDGRVEIETELRRIFTDHVTARYVSKVRWVRFLSPETALLCAVVGMVPPGKAELNPAANAIQTAAIVRQNRQWRITLFQNTPAQYHGRPEMVEQLTEELRELI